MKLDEANRTLNDFDAQKKKLSVENGDLLRQLEEADNQISQLNNLKASLTTQLEDTKKMVDDESRVSWFIYAYKSIYFQFVKLFLNVFIYGYMCIDRLLHRGD